MSKNDYRPIITGATGGSGSIAGSAPNRVEFRDFVKDKKGFALYVQALDAIYKDPFENDFSWPAIGGIHGDPYVRWGDSGPESFIPLNEDAFGGYCTHSSVLFPPWHRPYVALFEQSMQAAARKIADEYTTDKPEWLKAAENFRVPFWDWALPIAAGEQVVPEEMRSEEITIITPKGEQKVKNPVHSFTFQTNFPYTTFVAPYNAWQTTLRYPTSNEPNAKSQMDLFNTTFGLNSSQIRTQTFYMLTHIANWAPFSNDSAQQSTPFATSIEGIHNTMHLLIGGNIDYKGHMADIPVAGFDAAFFLHHANVDRLLALWQAINHDVWVTPGVQTDGTFTLAENSHVDAQTDLTPFWNTQSTYWKPNDVRDYVRALHYSYPDFDGLEGKSPTEIREAVLKRVFGLYGPGGVQMSSPDWAVHIRFKKFELGTSFSIQVFLGETYVGCVSAFTGASMERCKNCRNNQDVELEGFVHLNEAITQNLKLPALSPDVVKPALIASLNLKLQARKPDGTPADIKSDLQSLKAAPFSRSVSQDSPFSIPKLGEVTYYHDILTGKPGDTPADRW